MNRLIIAATALAAFFAHSAAAPLTPGQALARAGGNGPMKARALASASLVLAHTARTAKGNPAAYVFNRPDGGFVVLGADDLAYPVLGYSESGTFDASQMPPALGYWLEEYGRQIEYASANATAGVQPAKAPASDASRAAIEPMTKTHWDQVAPYNNQCPLSGTERTYTGCVATSMAQVMKYWNWPERGRGTISYTTATLTKRLTLDFSKRAFAWNDMIDSYKPGAYTEEQADAVAYLMKACGYSVKMDYGTDSSGALAMMAGRALVKYFDYDPNILYDLRIYHSASEWEKLVYENLRDVGPIVYGGASEIGGGHSFVCDGYDGQGYFHFNWGWTGMSNGYFSLDALNPDALGSGGGSGGGYNFTQDAVFGIRPPTGQPEEKREQVLTQMGALTASIADGKLTFGLAGQQQAMWVNYHPSTLHVMLGASFTREGSDAAPVYYDPKGTRFELQAGYGVAPSAISSINLDDAGLDDGTYRVSVVMADPEAAAPEWHAMKPIYGYPDYVTLTKQGDTYLVKSHEVPELTISSADFTRPLYYGCTTSVKIEVENKSDIELTRGFAPVLSDGQSLAWLGESVMLTVPPRSKVTREWNTDLYALQQYLFVTKETKYYLTFMDETSFNVYNNQFVKEVTMKPSPGAPGVSLVGDAKIEGARITGSAMRGFTAHVPDPSEMKVSATLRLDKGYFAYQALACLAQPSETEAGMVEVLTYGTSPVYLANVGDTSEMTTTVSYPDMTPGKRYFLLICYNYAGQITPVAGNMLTVMYDDPSGVDFLLPDDAETADDADATVTVVSIDGRTLLRAAPASALSTLAPGLYIINGRKRLLK